MKSYLKIVWVAAAAVALVAGLYRVQPVSAQIGPQGQYAIVVNSANGYQENNEQMRSTVRQLFLKKRSAWPGSEESKPFGPAKGSDAYKAFLSSVLQMSDSEVAQHWIALKQSTGQTAPREVKSERLLGKLLGKYPGAFSVMSAEAAAQADQARVLFLFD